ncbi:O-antigen ligase family protein [Thalassotalea litorea]|uniref:O-antigen ligase family protein n=1 Tax=Thalassotalea litorea TaxID=2020715 RepID=UPI003735ED57
MTLARFLRFDQNKTIFTTLLSVTFAILFVDGINAFETTHWVAFFEAIFIAVWILSNVKESLYRIKKIFYSSKLKLIWLWLLAVTVSCVQLQIQFASTEHLTIANTRYFYLLVHLFFLVSAYLFLSSEKLEGDKILMIIPWGMLLISFFYLIIISSGIHSKSIFGNPPLFSHIRYAGYLATVACVISIVRIVKGMALTDVKIDVFLLMINFTFLCWLGGRGSVLAIILTMMLLPLFFNIKTILKPLLLVFTVCIFSLMLAEYLSIFRWNGLGRFLSIFSSDISIDEYSSSRISIWIGAIKGFINQPVLGLGPDGYKFMTERVWGMQPHNVIIQFLVEWGVVGASLILAIIYKFIALIVKHSLSSKQGLKLLLPSAVFFSLTFHGLTDGTYYHAQPVFMIMLSVAIALSIIYPRYNVIQTSLKNR